MDWRIVSIMPMILWAFYAVFGSLASRGQGENLTMVFEAGAMLVIGIFALSRMRAGEFQMASMSSMTFAALMGICSALGVLVQLYAFKVAPATEQGTVVMLGGLFPVLALIIFHLMSMVGIAGGSPASSRQWLGVVFAVLALWLVSTGGNVSANHDQGDVIATER